MLTVIGWRGLAVPTVSDMLTIEASGSSGNGGNRGNREHQVFPVGRIVGTHGAGQHDALVKRRVTLAKDLESGLQVVKGPDEQGQLRCPR